MPPKKQYDETRDATTRRNGIDATKTTDNGSKNSFRSEEVFPRARNVSIDFVPDLTPYMKDLHRLPIRARIDFKILLLAFKISNDLALHCLSSLLLKYQSARLLR